MTESLDECALADETDPILARDSSIELSAPGQTAVTTSDRTPHIEQAASLTRQLYVSHFLSTWNSRVFEFGAVLFLARIFTGTLFPSSLYALVRAMAAIGFAPAIGEYIDQGERLSVIRWSIIGQRIAVILSCCVLGALMAEESILKGTKGSIGLSTAAVENTTWKPLTILFFAAACCLGAVEKLCSVMNTIAIERDWVVVTAKSIGLDLEALNSPMRRIDLFCKLLGPLCIALLDSLSTFAAICTVFGMSLVSVIIEYHSIARVYRRTTALQSPRAIRSRNDNGSDTSPLRGFARKRMKHCSKISLQYLNHPTFLPSIALCVLYLTVLSFSGQMVTYLISIRFTSLQIGLMRTASVLLEVSATWLAPMIITRIGSVRAGLWSINWQLLCLVPTVSLFTIIEMPRMAAFVMVTGVVLSRVGLWGFDLSVQQIVQESVEPESRGSFSSMETAFQNFFELCAYLSTIIFSRPNQFRYPIVFSAVAILVAEALFAKFVVDQRGHLVHLSKCMVGPGASTRWNFKRGMDIRVQDSP